MQGKFIIAGAVLACISTIPSCLAASASAAQILNVAAPLRGGLTYVGASSQGNYDSQFKKGDANTLSNAIRPPSSPGTSKETMEQQCRSSNIGKTDIVVNRTSLNCKRFLTLEL